MLQTTRFVPRVRDTLRELPEFPGELFYFTLIDPGAPNLAARAADATRQGLGQECAGPRLTSANSFAMIAGR